MAKRKKYEPWQTTDSIIRSALRRVWMWSKERRAALDATGKCCVECGAKQSKAKGREVKIEVHHKSKKIDWEKIMKVIRDELLVHPKHLKPMCKKCHKELHDEDRSKK